MIFGSANITSAGLGLTGKSNIELVSECLCNSQEYSRFKEIVSESFEIDDNFYNEMSKIKEKYKDKVKDFLSIRSKYLKALEWEDFLSPTWNRDDFMRKWIK